MGNDTRKPPPEQSARWYAEQYAALGWAVFPLHSVVNGVCSCAKGTRCGKQAGKHPRTRHGHQGAAIDAKTISRWKWETANVGIATGTLSGILVLDVDPRNGGNESFDRLKSELNELPPCPTVATGGGGLHLYFRHPGVVLGAQTSAPGIDIKTDGGYVVAPPSRHLTGGVYKWQVSPRKVPPPEMPAKWRQRFLVTQTTEEVVTQTTQRTQTTQTLQDNSEVSGTSCVGSPPATDGALDCFIRGVIQRTIPEHPGTRHKMIFQLARLLQGNAEIAGWSPQRLRPVVNEWFRQAQDKLGADGVKATADENWFDFSEGWQNVRFPGEGGLMVALLEKAKGADMPACAMQYETEEIRLVVKLCRELQRHAGDEPFFLSVSMVNDLILKAGENRMRGWRILRGLVFDGVLQEVTKGTASKRQASSFRYLGD